VMRSENCCCSWLIVKWNQLKQFYFPIRFEICWTWR